jgi:hypothetical protein
MGHPRSFLGRMKNSAQGLKSCPDTKQSFFRRPFSPEAAFQALTQTLKAPARSTPGDRPAVFPGANETSVQTL